MVTRSIILRNTHHLVRIRRVKCDETLPHCRRCTESGRKCEGPAGRQFRFVHTQPVSLSTVPVPQSELSLLVPRHSHGERRAFSHFTHHVAPILAGAVDTGFWNDLVPRLAQTQSFVWGIAVCTSSLFEHVPYSELTTTFDSTSPSKVINREHRQALTFYHRAIVTVRQLAERAQIDDSVVVLSYILFASVEFQQRNVRTAHNLVRRCCEILTQNLTSSDVRPSSIAGQAVHQVVTPFVLRRAVTIATLGNGPTPQLIANAQANDILEIILSKYQTLNMARAQFQSLMFDCYEFIRLADMALNINDDDPRKAWFMSQRQLLSDKLMRWKTEFTGTSTPTPDIEAGCICSYLLMYWSVCYVSLASCLSHRETVFDGYMDYFAELVEHATVYLRQSRQSQKVQLLSSIEPGVTPALYFCATKCRDPILRRESLRLIRQAPREESGWAFVSPDRVIAKLISIEEGESDPSRKEQNTGLPPEDRRFAYVSIVNRQSPGGRQRQALQLGRFEVANDGSRKLVTDYAWLDDAAEV